MSPSNLTDASRRIRGEAPSRVRANKERHRRQAGQYGAKVLISVESLRRCIEACECPWCGRSGFKSLASHTNQAHGIGRKELCDLAELPYSASIASPELHRRLSEKNKREGTLPFDPTDPGKGGRSSRSLSKAAIKAREEFRKVGKDIPSEVRKRAARQAAEKRRLPRPPCRVCGGPVAQRQRKTCSPECASVDRSRISVAVADEKWGTSDPKRRCTGCGKLKNADQFVHGLRCRTCRREYNRRIRRGGGS